MMNLKKDAVENTSIPTYESEILKAMDAKKQGDEPLASAEMDMLMCLSQDMQKSLSDGDRAALEELTARWQGLVFAGYALSCGYAPHTADGVGELLTAAPEGAAWRAENLRLTRAAEALASAVPEALPLSDRWDDLCTLALVLGQRR